MPLIKVVKFRGKAKSSFKNTVAYILGAKHKKGTVSLSGTRNLFSLDTAAKEMELFAAKARRANPILHCVVSFRPGDSVSPEQVEECIDIVISAMGFQNAQMVYALHEGKQKHIHIVANKIDPDTWKVMSPRKGDGRYFDILEKAGLEIDRRQNRRPVEHGLWILNEHNEIVENPDKFRANHTALSTRARDAEAHRGVKSWETIARERVGDTLHEAISEKKSWAWIHETLATRGVRVERHGKGLQFWLDSEHAVKGSRVDKKATLAALEKNLGPFQPREANVSIANVPLEIQPLFPTKNTQKSESKKQNQETAHGGNESEIQRNKFFSELKKEQDREWHDLLVLQKRERKKLRQKDWNGHWAEYYQLRSVLAAEQAGAKQDLKERQWREKILFFAAGGDIKDQIHAEKIDIRGYQPKVFKRCVEYHRIGKTDRADFIDYGRQISINKDYDETSILAAMQLAVQKWGRIKIYGDERFRQLCVKVAAENNFKLANEELAQQVKEMKEKLAFDKLNDNDNLKQSAENAKKRDFNKQQESNSPKTRTTTSPTPPDTEPMPKSESKLPPEPATETTGVQTFEYDGITYNQGERIKFNYHNQPTTVRGELVRIANGKATISFANNKRSSGVFDVSLDRGELRKDTREQTKPTAKTQEAEKSKSKGKDLGR